jgi:hypothetical protein
MVHLKNNNRGSISTAPLGSKITIAVREIIQKYSGLLRCQMGQCLSFPKVVAIIERNPAR